MPKILIKTTSIIKNGKMLKLSKKMKSTLKIRQLNNYSKVITLTKICNQHNLIPNQQPEVILREMKLKQKELVILIT